MDLYNKPGNFLLLWIRVSLFLFCTESFGSEIGQIEKIQKYLNNIKSLEANILQKDPYGNTTSGIIKLKKPGKLRIEYNSLKSDHIILASNGVLAIIDYGSNAAPLRYPISETPLKYLSDEKLDLLNPLITYKISTSKNQIKLEITEVKKSFSLGKIVLRFVENPISILGWEIPLNDDEKTEIILQNLKINPEIKDDLFYVSAEIMKFNNKINE